LRVVRLVTGVCDLAVRNGEESRAKYRVVSPGPISILKRTSTTRFGRLKRFTLTRAAPKPNITEIFEALVIKSLRKREGEREKGGNFQLLAYRQIDIIFNDPVNSFEPSHYKEGVHLADKSFWLHAVDEVIFPS
jgi:hypothetical protein